MGFTHTRSNNQITHTKIEFDRPQVYKYHAKKQQG